MPVARHLQRPTRGLGSAPLPPANRGYALLFGLAPGRVCRVSPRRPKAADSSLWHWSSPRGGRALPATPRCGARTFLVFAGVPTYPRPSGHLAGDRILARTLDDHGRTTGDPPEKAARPCRRSEALETAAWPGAMLLPGERSVTGAPPGGGLIPAPSPVGSPASEATTEPPASQLRRQLRRPLAPRGAKH